MPLQPRRGRSRGAVGRMPQLSGLRRRQPRGKLFEPLSLFLCFRNLEASSVTDRFDGSIWSLPHGDQNCAGDETGPAELLDDNEQQHSDQLRGQQRISPASVATDSLELGTSRSGMGKARKAIPLNSAAAASSSSTNCAASSGSRSETTISTPASRHAAASSANQSPPRGRGRMPSRPFRIPATQNTCVRTFRLHAPAEALLGG